MICKSCKYQMPDNYRFCPRCGEKLASDEIPTQSMQLICKACGSVLSCNEDNPVLFCPSCGSKELLFESDAVKIERMRTKAQREIELDKHQIYKDVELNRIKAQNEIEEVAQLDKKAASYKKGKLYKWTIAFLAISIISCISIMSSHRFLQSLVAFMQVLCFAASLLAGLQLIFPKKYNLHVLFAIIGFSLYIPLIVLGPNTSNQNTLLWQTNGLFSQLPMPETMDGNMHNNTDTRLWFNLNNVDREQYQRYYNACIAAGYVIEASLSSMTYKAFNSEGYHLELQYYSNHMGVLLDAPLRMGNISWPTTELSKMLPVPPSSYGRIERDSSTSFRAYVGNMDKEQYAIYVQSCVNKGFTVDHDRTETRYNAKNKKGYSLIITYEGFNVILISIYAP